MVASGSGWLGLLCVAWLLGACTGSDTDTAPYDGPPAYPNRRPQYPSEGRTLGYVTNHLSDTISVVDLDAMLELGQAPVGRGPVDIDGPRHLVIDRAHGVAYVALAYPAAIDGSAGNAVRPGYVQALALPDLRVLGELRLEPNPGAVALSDDGERLAIAHYDLTLAARSGEDLEARRASLWLIDPAAVLKGDASDAQRLTLCVAPWALAFAGTRLYGTCTGEEALAVVDPSQPSVLARVEVPQQGSVNKPWALAVNAEHSQLAVSNKVSRSLALFDLGEDAAEPAFQASVSVPGVPYFGAWSGATRLIVPLQSPDGAALLDMDDAQLVVDVRYDMQTCVHPQQVRAISDGRVFMVCEGDHFSPGTLVQLDPDTLHVMASVSLGLDPDWLAVVEP